MRIAHMNLHALDPSHIDLIVEHFESLEPEARRHRLDDRYTDPQALREACLRSLQRAYWFGTSDANGLVLVGVLHSTDAPEGSLRIGELSLSVRPDGRRRTDWLQVAWHVLGAAEAADYNHLQLVFAADNLRVEGALRKLGLEARAIDHSRCVLVGLRRLRALLSDVQALRGLRDLLDAMVDKVPPAAL